MSYSFTVKAPTKAEVAIMVANEFDRIVGTQPKHAVDRDAAVATAGAFIDMLVEPQGENEEVQVSVNGSLSWAKEGFYTSAAVNVNASVRTKV